VANRHERPRRPTKWTSSQSTGNIPDSNSLVVGDGLALTTPTTESINRPDPTAIAIRGQISVGRNNAGTDKSNIAWAIVLMRLGVGSTTPIQIFDPYDTGDLERQDILGMGFLPVPPVVLTPSSDAAAVDRQSTAIDVHIRSSRIVKQNTNNLFFWIASTDLAPPGSDDAFFFRASFRTLLKW